MTTLIWYNTFIVLDFFHAGSRKEFNKWVKILKEKNAVKE